MIAINRNTIRDSKEKILNTISDGSYKLFQNNIYNPLDKFYISGIRQSAAPFQYPEWESEMGSFLSEEEYKEFLYALE